MHFFREKIHYIFFFTKKWCTTVHFHNKKWSTFFPQIFTKNRYPVKAVKRYGTLRYTKVPYSCTYHVPVPLGYKKKKMYTYPQGMVKLAPIPLRVLVRIVHVPFLWKTSCTRILAPRVRVHATCTHTLEDTCTNEKNVHVTSMVQCITCTHTFEGTGTTMVPYVLTALYLAIKSVDIVQ